MSHTDTLYSKQKSCAASFFLEVVLKSKVERVVWGFKPLKGWIHVCFFLYLQQCGNFIWMNEWFVA